MRYANMKESETDIRSIFTREPKVSPKGEII